ncbi:MAG: major facilitator superfamily domain-containing protein [Benjaminiella poitrasii]|nr:MAG: major facilitator superfamily domain-containing protein [Benjaminiella poitrasii]
MNKTNDNYLETVKGDVEKESQRSSMTYGKSNDATLMHVDLEKIPTVKTEKYDLEAGKLGTIIEPQDTNVTIASIIELPKDPFYDTIPDGGYGWVVTFAGFLIYFIMNGISCVWGVFSNAWATTILKDKASTIELMGVGTTLVVCLNIFTPVSPLLARLGARVTVMIGSTLMSLGIILAGFSTEVWHLYLTQGVLFGIGASLVYMSIVAVIPQWFTAKRGTAMGISSAGAGIGGLALSPMASSLVQKYGLPWAYRIVGLFAFGVCTIAAVLIRTRLPPDHNKQPIRSPIKLSLLKNVNFVILLIGLVISLTGNLVPYFYLPKYCTTYGIDASSSSTIVAVLCAMNAVGRLVLGYFADRIGRLNMFVISAICTGLFCMLIWPFAKTYGALMAFAALFGFTCGIYYTLSAPITASVVGTDNISSGLSIMFLASAISALGPPISSAIQQATPNAGYIGVQMFSGATYIFGALICIALKIKMTGSLFSIM